MAAQSRRSPVIALLLLLLAIVCVAGAIFYWTVRTSLFASFTGLHHRHAIVLAVLALVFLAAAAMTRPRPAT